MKTPNPACCTQSQEGFENKGKSQSPPIHPSWLVNQIKQLAAGTVGVVRCQFPASLSTAEGMSK